ncbi:MAG: ABC transporter substrate-binding protein [Caldilineaceae bacterium]|nr:ABC transporter substrate-binding protein [Caldilineaceae bacterium]
MKRTWSRKAELCRMLGAFLITLMLTGCLPRALPAIPAPETDTTQSHPADRVRACYSGVSATHIPLWYAYEQGIFEKYGLDVELTLISSGSQVAAALLAGESDFCQVGGTAVVNAAIADADTILIAGIYNVHLFSLVARPEIQSGEDLRGKSVAINQPGDSIDIAIQVALAELGLDPDEDVTILNVGTEGERLAAMATGQIAATVVGVPIRQEVGELGYHLLFDLSALELPNPRLGIATTRAYMAEHRQIAVRFMQAMLEAIAEMKRDAEGTKRVLAQYLSLDAESNADYLDSAYEALVEKYLPTLPYPTMVGLEEIIAEALATNPGGAVITPEDVVDLSILQELETSGFVAGLYP